ncbi:MAG: methyltransferase [Candidatus Lokiarchaeota archaeon]|nr:methyltransferase [Candidatus Lokiarchaeota archaeon]
MIDYFRRNIDNTFFDRIKLEDIDTILDMGTGTGIIAIFLQHFKSLNSNFNPRIFASDILKESIKCAKNNERLNQSSSKIIYLQSDLFLSFPKSLRSTFNIIIFNPPYLPSLPKIEEQLPKKKIDHSWDGGLKGIEIIIDFLKDVKNFLNLNKAHYIYFISSNRCKLDELETQIINLGFKHEKLEKTHIFFEDIILNRLQYIPG